jgi:hypothetical protein
MAAVAGHTGAIYLMTNASSNSLSNEALTDAGDHATFTDGTLAHVYWDDTHAPVVQVKLDAVQTVTVTGSPAGGTFTLTFGGNTTTGIAYNAAASAVQTALQALASIGAGNALVTGSVGGPYTVEFAATLGYAAQATMTFSGAGLTGGSSPNVTVVVAQVGQAFTTASAGLYTVQYVGGKIIFTVPYLGTSVGCQVSSGGKYFAYSTLAQGRDWEFTGSRAMADSTVMGGGRAKTWVPTLTEGVFTIKLFWVDASLMTNITTGFRLIFSGVVPGGHRYEAYSFIKDDKVHDALTGLIEEDVTFQVTGNWYYN